MENIEANMTLQTQFNAQEKRKKSSRNTVLRRPCCDRESQRPLSFRTASRSHFCFQPLIQELI